MSTLGIAILGTPEATLRHLHRDTTFGVGLPALDLSYFAPTAFYGLRAFCRHGGFVQRWNVAS